jgi:hypothetical protein
MLPWYLLVDAIFGWFFFLECFSVGLTKGLLLLFVSVAGAGIATITSPWDMFTEVCNGCLRVLGICGVWLLFVDLRSGLF